VVDIPYTFAYSREPIGSIYSSCSFVAQRLCTAILSVEEEIRMTGLDVLRMFFLLPRTNQLDPFFSDA
jgi:hypothetical protein